MSTIEERITEIGHWLDKGEAGRPERELETLIRQMRSAELSEWRREIEDSIQRFRPKRRRNLSKILESKTGNGDPGRVPGANAPSTKSTPREPARTLDPAADPEVAADFRRALDALRERHVFQWSTFYRDCLAEYLGRFLDEMRRVPPSDGGRSLSVPLASHTRDAFDQGYGFARGKHGHEEAMRKSLNGLSRFLTLPLDFYSVRSSASSDDGSASALRLLVSAAVSGILEGYSSTSFGPPGPVYRLPDSPLLRDMAPTRRRRPCGHSGSVWTRRNRNDPELRCANPREAARCDSASPFGCCRFCNPLAPYRLTSPFRRLK